MRYYAIGDIHGRHDLLEKALVMITDHANGTSHKTVTLGDYVDRGPESNKVIKTLMEHNNEDFICLQGNHEAMMVDSILKCMKPQWWMGNGGDHTLESYGHPVIDSHDTDIMYSFVPQEHVQWLAALPKYYEAEKQVFVHAGIPQWNMNLPFTSKRADRVVQMEEDMQWMLYHPADHGGWKGKHVVHGHHQFSDGPHTWKDGKKGGRTNLDTYAWKHGRLVVGVFDDTQLEPIDFIEVCDETHG